MAQMNLASFLRQVRLAIDLVESGSIPTRLEPTPDVLDALAIVNVDRQQLATAPLHEQLDLLRPHLTRYLELQKQAKAESAARAAQALAEQLRQGAQLECDCIRLPVQPLVALASVQAFTGLRLQVEGTLSWSFPRLAFSKILRSVRHCSDVVARLEATHLRLSYTARSGGRGQIVLRDQAIPDWRDDVLSVSLPVFVEEPAVAAPAAAARRPARQRPPKRSVPPSPSPGSAWLTEVAYALVDGLMAR